MVRLLLGDILLALDGDPITGPESLRDALAARADKSVAVTVLRAGHTEDLTITIGSWS